MAEKKKGEGKTQSLKRRGSRRRERTKKRRETVVERLVKVKGKRNSGA